MRTIDFDKLEGALLNSLLRSESVTDLFARVYECVDMPLICFDTAFRLIAYAFPRPFYYKNWEYIAEHGAASESDILGYGYLEYQERMYKSGRSVIFDSGTCEGYPQACGPVFVDGHLVAYCGIMIEDGIHDEALRANDLVSRAVASRIRSVLHDREYDAVERLLVKSQCSTEDEASITGNLPGPYCFVTFYVPDRLTTLEYVRGTLCTRDRHAVGCIYSGERLYMLQGGMTDAQASERCLESYETLAQRYGLECGVSDIFSRLGEISERRAQSLLALSARQGKSPVRTFRGNYVEIVENCIEGYFGPEASQLPALDPLIAYDQDGELVHTLKLYLMRLRRQAVVAEELGLHRNTVINRIKKAEELLGDHNHDDNELLIGLDMRMLAKEGDENV